MRAVIYKCLTVYNQIWMNRVIAVDQSSLIAIYTNQDRSSLPREFDKQPRDDTSLAHNICVLLWNYDCKRPIFNDHSYSNYLELSLNYTY